MSPPPLPSLFFLHCFLFIPSPRPPRNLPSTSFVVSRYEKNPCTCDTNQRDCLCRHGRPSLHGKCGRAIKLFGLEGLEDVLIPCGGLFISFCTYTSCASRAAHAAIFVPRCRHFARARGSHDVALFVKRACREAQANRTGGVGCCPCHRYRCGRRCACKLNTTPARNMTLHVSFVILSSTRT